MGIKVNFTRAVGPVMATFVAPLLRVMPTFLCQKRNEGWDSFVFIGYACSLFKISRLLNKKTVLFNYILSNSFMITQKHFNASNFFMLAMIQVYFLPSYVMKLQFCNEILIERIEKELRLKFYFNTKIKIFKNLRTKYSKNFSAIETKLRNYFLNKKNFI